MGSTHTPGDGQDVSAPPLTAAAPHDLIAQGRHALAERQCVLPPRQRCADQAAVSNLLALLWHPDERIRRSAVLALPGGDRTHVYEPLYGYFASSFLRYLGQHSPADRPPPNVAARHLAVVEALREMLKQSCSDICAMSSMHYSFLSSALYLALLSTCRDVTQSVRRLRDCAAHPELCTLLWSLTQRRVVRCLNAKDVAALTNLVGQALAAMPADEITDFWRCLTHQARARRRAVAPTLRHLKDGRAVPHLLQALSGQPIDVAQSVITCLGRLGDPIALPALLKVTTSSEHRTLRAEARIAVDAIGRTSDARSGRILLRPVGNRTEDPTLLLRSIACRHSEYPADQLLRTALPSTSDA